MTPTEFDPLGLAHQLANGAGSLVLDPASRTYWAFLLSALLIAVALSWRDPALRTREGRRATWSRLLSPSARVDYVLTLIRPVVSALLITPWLVTAYGLAVGTALTLRAQLGPAGDDWLTVPAWSVSLAFTVVLFVAWDLSRFALHWAMHRFDVLWQLHQVHHSAESLNPFTLYRVHPLERVLYRLRGVLVTGLLTGAFFYLFESRAVQLQLLGVNAVGVVFNALGGNLRHAHARWGWGPLEGLVISPAQHQIHHQRLDADVGFDALSPQDQRAMVHGANFGTWLACWDRMAGTLVRSRDVRPGPFGLAELERNHDPRSVLSAIFDPVVAMATTVGSKLRRLPNAIGAEPLAGAASQTPHSARTGPAVTD